MEKQDKKLKSKKYVKIVSGVMALSIVAGAFAGCGTNKYGDDTASHTTSINTTHVAVTQAEDYVSKIDTDYSSLSPKQALKKAQNTKMYTYLDNYGTEGNFLYTNEDECHIMSEIFRDVIMDYFKYYEASDWVSDDLGKFWPDNMAELMTAIAYKESSFRTNLTNDEGFTGMMQLDEASVLKSLENWMNAPAWGDNGPYINCNPDQIDMHNPTKCLEYSYYYMGYILCNFLKENKRFKREADGKYYCVWDYVKFSEETQLRALIASYRFGPTKVTDAMMGMSKDNETANTYLNSEYVNTALEHMQRYINQYGVENALGQ